MLKKLQGSLSHKLGVSLVIAITPLIFLKFGVQIREGLALCIWLSVLLSFNRRPHPVIFFVLAFLSSSVHLASAPLWILLALALYFRHWPRVSFLIAIVVFSVFTYLVADISRLESEAFSGLSTEILSPNLFTTLYWLIYPGVFIFSILQRDTRRSVLARETLSVRTFGFVLRAAMIGLIFGLAMAISLEGNAFFQKGIVADLLRLSALLLSLYCVFLSIQKMERKAILLAVFLIFDTARIILDA
jgi:hypothetical protein